MIGKAKSIAHTGAAIDYGLNKENAYELTREGVVGESGTEIQNEFGMFQKLNGNCNNHTISAVLSPSVEDGNQLTNEQLRDITTDYLKQMGLEGHQFVSYVHQDKAHKHVHLYVNRINPKGKAFNDSFIGKKSQRIADKVAKEHGIVRAKEVQQRKELGLKHTKEQIKGIHVEVMKSKPKDFGSYTKLMEGKGVKIAPTINKAGKLQGYRIGFAKEGMMKASQVNRAMTLAKLQPHFLAAQVITKTISKGFGIDHGGHSL